MNWKHLLWIVPVSYTLGMIAILLILNSYDQYQSKYFITLTDVIRQSSCEVGCGNIVYLNSSTYNLTSDIVVGCFDKCKSLYPFDAFEGKKAVDAFYR